MINVRIYSYKPLDSRLFPLVFGYQAVAQVLGSNFALWGCQIFCKPGWGVGAYSNMSWWMMMDDDESLSPHLLTHASRTIVSCVFFFQLCATSINKMPHQNILGGYTGMEVPMHQAGNRTVPALLLSWLSSLTSCFKRAQCLVVSRHYSYKE